MGDNDTIIIKKSTMRIITYVAITLIAVVSFTGGYFTGVNNSSGAVVAQQPSLQPQIGQEAAVSSRIQVSLDDDPQLGDRNAKVMVIEFSDFQCPFCRRFYIQTLPQLEKDYIDTGKILFVYRDFPLDSIHPGARPAAAAAECADEQGKWKEYHDKIFDEQNKQGEGTVQLGVDDLKKWASDIGLDTQQFNQCLDSNKYDAEVSKDFQDGVQAGVSGTPTFYIGSPQNGYIELVGAQPYSIIKQVIDQELSA
ncbi:MAG: thioredoxin domain-containing protein [Candidatus Aenigmarchaeota archaeon]|nr:thioredoxin domain-containing protein [Candidatus Aenigmarchaeota archaeon]